MKKQYVCSICENSYDSLETYLKCVSTCGAKLQKERDEAVKRAEEVNAALNKVKAAKSYYEEQLKDFKEKYPEEYYLNFSSSDDCDDWCDFDCDNCHRCDDYDDELCNFEDCENQEKEPISNVVIYTGDDGEGNLKFAAFVNGKEVNDDSFNELLNDPAMSLIANMLGLNKN